MKCKKPVAIFEAQFNWITGQFDINFSCHGQTINKTVKDLPKELFHAE